MKKDPVIFLKHIKENIERIEQQVENINKELFFKNIDIQDATARRVEIIGEAVKNLPLSFRKKYPQIPWKAIAGFRDKLIHHYFGIDLGKMWKVVKDDLPFLKKEINNIIDDLEK